MFSQVSVILFGRRGMVGVPGTSSLLRGGYAWYQALPGVDMSRGGGSVQMEGMTRGWLCLG